MNKTINALLAIFMLSFAQVFEAQEDYYDSVQNWLEGALKNAEAGDRTTETERIRVALDSLRKTDLNELKAPLTLWFDITQVNKGGERLLVVYWAFNEPDASTIAVNLKSGGSLLFSIHDDYIQENKELFDGGEGMYAVVSLSPTEELAINITSADISNVSVLNESKNKSEH